MINLKSKINSSSQRNSNGPISSGSRDHNHEEYENESVYYHNANLQPIEDSPSGK